jgi:RimJ/RimL family protein N-acetyltransferase
MRHAPWVRVTAYDNADDFWLAAGPLLSADPVENTVLVTVLSRLLRGLVYGPDPAIMLAMHEGTQLTGVALATPPYPLSVGAVPESAAPAVVEHLLVEDQSVSGASGLRPRVEAFARAWAEATGDTVKVNRDERLYRLDRLVPPVGVPGWARLATGADIPLLARWRQEFAEEALGDEYVPVDFADQSRNSLSAGSANMLWIVDDTAVALAVAGRPQQHMSRVGPVYTPAHLRGRGYGSAVTAAVSRWALDEQARHVVLFTDLANPTSNSIYQQIGYRPASDHLNVAFVPAR